MDVFDIIGPVMIGPSSSHTAGAVRIGNITAAILGETPAEAVITLHGSFASTYKGHGTDRALVAGLLGMKPDDPGIKDSLGLAAEAGLKYRFVKTDIRNAHPNTARVLVRGKSGREVTVTGASVGGGNVVIRRINDLKVEFQGEYPTLVIPHTDTPGAVAAVTGMLAMEKINIAQMKVYRSKRGGTAIMVIETDQEIHPALPDKIGRMPGMAGASLVNPVA